MHLTYGSSIDQICVWPLQVWREIQICSSCWSAGSWSRFARSPGRRTASSNCRKTARRCGTSPTKHSGGNRLVSIASTSVPFIICTKLKHSSTKFQFQWVFFYLGQSQPTVFVSCSSVRYYSVNIEFSFQISTTASCKHTPQIPLVLQNMWEVGTWNSHRFCILPWGQTQAGKYLFVCVRDYFPLISGLVSHCLVWICIRPPGLFDIPAILVAAAASRPDNLWSQPELCTNHERQSSAHNLPRTDTADTHTGDIDRYGRVNGSVSKLIFNTTKLALKSQAFPCVRK